METDPVQRLVKLISLVAYTEGDKCGLRPTHWDYAAPNLAQDQALAAEEMCAYYAGAVGHMRGDNDPAHRQDYDDLADFTLRFVTNADVDSDAELVLGSILARSLGLLDGTEVRMLGRKWLADVLDACWVVKVAAKPAQFGIDQ